MEASHSKTSHKGNKKELKNITIDQYNSFPKSSKNVHLTNFLNIVMNTTCYQNIDLHIGSFTVVRPIFSSWLMILYRQWKTSLLQQSQSLIYLWPLTLLVMTFYSLYLENNLELRMWLLTGMKTT